MTAQIVSLTKQDITKATAVLEDAFWEDPLWQKVFTEEERKKGKLHACFEVSIRICLRDGGVFASSDQMEGVAAWLWGERSRMSLWQILRSGGLWTALGIGAKAGRKMQQIFQPLEEDRLDHMKDRDFVYLLAIGVSRAQQGHGLGGKLLRALFAMCERERRDLYLETETEENVRLYEKFGFRCVKKIDLPGVGHPIWQMLKSC